MDLKLLRSGAGLRIASLAVVAVLVADVVTLAVVDDAPTADQDVVAGPRPGLPVVHSPPPTSTSTPVTVALIPPTSPLTTRLAPTTLATTTTALPPAPASLLGQILFISNRTSEPPVPTPGPVTPGSGGYELWAMKADGSSQRQLTFDGAGNAQPSLSPDGTRIAWIVGDSAVWVMNADGSDARALTDSSEYRMFPRWSPDGRRIAYVRTGDHNIVIMNADGSGAQVLSTPAVEEYSARWSPDGTRLAVNISGAEPGLLVMDVATTSQELIRQGTSSGPAWSPDGSAILFSDGNQLHTIAPDGTGLRQLSSGPGQHLRGSWSPDGRTIAFDYFSQQPDASQQIYVMNADGSGSRTITNASGDNYEATF